MPARENHSTSSAKYNGSRQVHQNKLRFNPLRHQPDKLLPASVTRPASSLCCRRCQLILKWKLDYGKYPSLVQIRKSVRCCGACGEKAVSIPFHHICQPCAEELAICAKCRLSADESESRAMDAVRKGLAMNEEDAEYYASLGGADGDDGETSSDDDDDNDDDDDEKKKNDPHRRKTRIHEDNGEVPEEEEEFPELIRLRGLDVSLLRFQLEEAKKEATMNAIKGQGKLRERDRRSAMRLLKQGDEDGALAVTKRCALRQGDNANDAEDEDDEDEKDEQEEEDEDVPVKNMTKDSQLDLNKLSKQNQEPRSLAAAVALKPKLNLAQSEKKSANNNNNNGDETPSDEETL